MKILVRHIRPKLYRLGFRPKAGSIWHSPSLSYIYSFHKGLFNK